MVDETQIYFCYEMSSTKQSNCGWEYPDRNGRRIGQIRRLLNNSKGGSEHQRFGNLSCEGNPCQMPDINPHKNKSSPAKWALDIKKQTKQRENGIVEERKAR